MPLQAFRPEVPQPPAQPLNLGGFLRAVRTNALTIWPQQAYQDPIFVRRFLGRLNILMNEPEGMHHVLVANAQNYRRSPASVRILRPITGRGLLLSEGEAWKAQRRSVAPALAPRVMPILARHVVRTLDAFVPQLARRSGQPIDLLAEMQRLALEIAGRSMFSLEMDRYGAAIREALLTYANHHARPSACDMLLPPSIPTLGDFGRGRFHRRWMRLIETILYDRLRSPCPEQPNDLLDLLRMARDPITGQAFSSASLRDQVATLLVAGHETTAVTLFWSLFLLIQSGSDMDRLVAEVDGVTIQAEAAAADQQCLPFTRAVVNEALRLFPPAFTIVREAIAEDRIGALSVPARSVVMIAPWVLHRHQRLWDDPAAFRPDRFLPDAPAPPKFAFLPFGAGPRVCVGAQFALTEATLVLARLLQSLTFEPIGPVTVRPLGVVTTQPDGPLRVRVRSRARV